MKAKFIIAAAAAGFIWTAGASADQWNKGEANLGQPTIGSALPFNDPEVPASMGTIHSLDTRTGGYRGWGPMANPSTPTEVSESNPSLAYFQQKRDEQQQLAEVRQVRDQVWVANAPLRSEYENIGATRSHAGGFGSFFHRDSSR